MKKQTLRLPVLMLSRLIAVALSTALAVAVPAVAQHHHYKLIDTGTLGGPSSFLGFEGSRNINNRGVVAATTDTSMEVSQPFCLNDCFEEHATAWQDGALTDLGTIPGGSGGTAWISDTGLITGLAFNGLIDPVTGVPEFDPILWKDGGPINLGTFGGTQGIAGSVNNSGQVVGCATNTISDSFSVCMGVPGATQSRAFLWKDGAMQDLGTLGGPDANAFFVNERGQVSGWSYTNSNPSANCPFPLNTEPFLWSNHKMVDLGTLGGSCGYPNWLNNRGEVVGQSNLAGDVYVHPFLARRERNREQESLRDLGTLGGNFGSAYSISEVGEVVGWATTPGDAAIHAFLWKHGVMSDLGVLDGKVCSVAYAINSRAQIVGFSDDDCNRGNSHAFLSEHSSLIDLNMFVPHNSGTQLTFALSINERGEIAALGSFPNGDQHSFLLIPCDDDHPGVEGCDYSLYEASGVTNGVLPSINAQTAGARHFTTSDLMGSLRRHSTTWYQAHGKQPRN